MNQFSDAIQQGMKSAREAASNVTAIKRVISEMSEAVKQATDGVVSVQMTKVPVTPSVFGAMTEALVNLGGGQLKLHDAISLKRTVSPYQIHELARLDISPSGYPCEVITESRKLNCHDTESFVKVLKDLLSSPDSGKAILNLKAIKASSAERDSAGGDGQEPPV